MSSSPRSESPLKSKSKPKRKPPPPPRPRPESWSRIRLGRLSCDIAPASTPERIERLSAMMKTAARNSRKRANSVTKSPSTPSHTQSPTQTQSPDSIKGIFPRTPTSTSSSIVTQSSKTTSRQDEMIQNLIETAQKKMSRKSITQTEYNQVIRVALPSIQFNFTRQPSEKAGYLSKRSRWMHNWNLRYVRLRLNTGFSKRVSVQKRTFGTSSTLPLLEWWDDAYSVVARGCVRVRGVAMCSTKEMRRMAVRGEVAYGFVVFGT